MKTSKISPALVLFFLAPIISELLTGSTSPLQFINPFKLLLLAALYGSGAILCRELTCYWRKGWPTVLALGAACGVIAEGLAVKSFFDPGWRDLGPLGVYGRWAGVNWVWSLEMTLYHAVFSIAIPILLVNLLFPARRTEAWIKPRTFQLLAILLAAAVLIFWLLTPYHPPLLPYIVAIIVVMALLVLARQLPDTIRVTQSPQVARPFVFAALSFLATLAFFLLSWIVPYTPFPPPLLMAALAALGVYVLRTVMEMSGNATTWSEQHQLALATGALSFFILLAPFLELFHIGGRDRTGLTLVALATLAGLLLLRWWLSHREKRNVPTSGWV